MTKREQETQSRENEQQKATWTYLQKSIYWIDSNITGQLKKWKSILSSSFPTTANLENATTQSRQSNANTLKAFDVMWHWIPISTIFNKYTKKMKNRVDLWCFRWKCRYTTTKMERTKTECRKRMCLVEIHFKSNDLYDGIYRAHILGCQLISPMQIIAGSIATGVANFVLLHVQLTPFQIVWVYIW